jgi:hypothetical protein
MNSKFEQRAGAHSHQTVNIGLSAADALQIVDNRIKVEFEGLRQESIRQIADRLEMFGDRLVADLAKAGRLDMAADPNLWTAIQAASREAAATETESDIDFLVDLLVERSKDPSNRRRRTTVDGAIKVINSLDEESLLGITLLYGIYAFRPSVAGGPREHLKFKGRLLRYIARGGVPSGSEWIEHAITIGAAQSVMGLRPLEDYHFDDFSWSLSPGIQEGASDMSQALSLVSRVRKGGVIAVGSPYINDRSVAPWRNAEEVRLEGQKNGITDSELDQLVEEICRLWHIGEVDPEARRQFIEDLDAHPQWPQLRTWVASLRPPINLTPIGEMVGLVNMRRLLPQFMDPKTTFVVEDASDSADVTDA